MEQPVLSQQPSPEMMRELAYRQELGRLANTAKSGINNFYWIAGLSVINSLVSVFGSGFQFVAGLALTQIVDAFSSVFIKNSPDLTIFFRLLQLGLDLGIIGLFVLFGYFGIKGHRWVIIVGMILYALDGILMLIFQDIISFGFHLFFLWGLWSGLRAINQLHEILRQQQEAQPQGDFLAKIG